MSISLSVPAALSRFLHPIRARRAREEAYLAGLARSEKRAAAELNAKVAPLRNALEALLATRRGAHLMTMLQRAYVTHDLDDAASGTQLAISLHRGPDLVLTRRGYSEPIRPRRTARQAEGDEGLTAYEYGRLTFRPVSDETLARLPEGALAHVAARMGAVAQLGLKDALVAYRERASARSDF